MDSRDIARFIGKKTWLRRFGFQLIYWTTLREWYVRTGLRNILQKDQPFTFLDAGSGLGQHAYLVARLFPDAKIKALELDGEQVNDCRRFVKTLGLENVEFRQGDLASAHLPEQVDAVLCCSVLEHIRADESVLATFHKVLKKDGKMLIYVPTSEQRVLPFLDRKINNKLKKSGRKLPHEHVRYYSKEELIKKLKKSGFDVENYIVTYGHYGRLAYDIVTFVQYHFWFKYMLPFYLGLVHPFVLLLMWADFKKKNFDGNGLMIIARKSR